MRGGRRCCGARSRRSPWRWQGRAGARLAGGFGLPAGRSNDAAADPRPARSWRGRVLLILGVDDFALRRGHVYGSVLVNMGTRRPVDLLPDREADTFAAWLQRPSRHPGDLPGPRRSLRRRFSPGRTTRRSRSPTGGTCAHNLAERVDKAVARHRSCLIEPEPEPVAARRPGARTRICSRPRPRPLPRGSKSPPWCSGLAGGMT